MNAIALAGLLAVQWAEAPYLAPGDRVRVHVVVQHTFLGMPVPRLSGVKYGGTLTFYAADDSLTLERDKWLFARPYPEAVRLNWIEINRIDVPAGRDWLGGAVGGAEAAFAGALGVAFLCSIAGGNAPGAEGCPFWKNVGQFALVTVPVGAIIGSRFTRWKPVYKRKR